MFICREPKLPSHWKLNQIVPNSKVLAVVNPSKSANSEYSKVAAKLHETLPGAKIASIHRIQNSKLFFAYEAEKKISQQNGQQVDIQVRNREKKEINQENTVRSA